MRRGETLARLSFSLATATGAWPRLDHKEKTMQRIAKIKKIRDAVQCFLRGMRKLPSIVLDRDCIAFWGLKEKGDLSIFLQAPLKFLIRGGGALSPYNKLVQVIDCFFDPDERIVVDIVH